MQWNVLLFVLEDPEKNKLFKNDFNEVFHILNQQS